MAVAYGATGSQGSISGGSKLTISWPAHSSGDIGYLILCYRHNDTPSAWPPTDWNNLGAIAPSSDTDMRLAIAWRRATSSGESDVTINWSPAPTFGLARICTVTGAKASGTPHGSYVSTNEGSVSAGEMLTAFISSSPSNCLPIFVVVRNDDSASADFSSWSGLNISDGAEQFDTGSSTGSGGGYALAVYSVATGGGDLDFRVTSSRAIAYGAIVFAVEPATSTPKTCSATLNESATLARSAGKIVAATKAIVTTITSALSFVKVLTKTLTATAYFDKGQPVVLSAALGAAGAVSKGLAKTLSVVDSTVATFRKAVGKSALTTINALPRVIKGGIPRVVSTALTLAASLLTSAPVKQTVAAVQTVVGTLAWTIGKALSVSIATSALLGRLFGKVVSQIIYGTTSLRMLVDKTFSLGLSCVPTLVRLPARVLTAALITGATATLLAGKSLELRATISGSIRRGVRRVLTRSLGLLATMPRHAFTTMLATTTAAGQFVSARRLLRTISTGLTGVASVLKSTGKVLGRALTSSATLAKPFTRLRTLALGVGLTATLGHLNTALLSVTVICSGSILKGVRKTISLVSALLVTLRRANVLVLTASLITLTASLRHAKFIAASLRTSITGAASMLFLRGRVMTAALTASARLLRQLGLTFRTTTTSTARVVKSATRACSTVLSAGASLTAQRTLYRLLSSTASVGAILFAPATLRRVITGTATLTATRLLGVGKLVVKIASAFPTVLRPATLLRALTSVISLTPTIRASRLFARVLSAPLSVVSTLLAPFRLERNLVAPLSTIAVFLKSVVKRLAVTVNVRSTLRKFFPMVVQTVLSLTASLLTSRPVLNVIDTARRVLAPWRIRIWRA